MFKWKSMCAVAALSLGVIGCSPAADQAQDSAYHGAGTNGARNMAVDDTGMNAGLNGYANGNVNDQGFTYRTPGNYANNAMFKDGNMSLQQANNTARQYGWATYSKRDMNIQQANTFRVDRNVLARAIGTVATSVPGVENSSVLVTDEDIFIGISGNTDKSTLNKVKLSAWSMSPRYYKIYVTGDQGAINRVKALVNRANTNRGLDQAKLDSILQDQRVIDMTGTNVTDNGQNITNYNLDQTYPNTNGAHRMRNQ